ncbi:hypothetical protein CK203_091665 [Vitis vinifera]|uniref:Uncharacterized protein n=1 Tax=Vitis vinifera TaxID=29760 RepID=A0A438FAZ3_VITVI|nr:hypothetical protein CK203_091665 [Vitis vinifera]
MQKTKDNLHSEQAALKKRLKLIMGEVQMQEKLNERASEDIQNLRKSGWTEAY